MDLEHQQYNWMKLALVWQQIYNWFNKESKLLQKLRTCHVAHMKNKVTLKRYTRLNM